jgi:hypothetical protein
MQQLPGLRVDRGGMAEEPVGVLVPHDPRHFGGTVVALFMQLLPKGLNNLLRGVVGMTSEAAC